MTSQTEIERAIKQAFADRGREGGKIGGPARAAALTKKQRSALARKAGIASGAARARKAKGGAK